MEPENVEVSGSITVNTEKRDWLGQAEAVVESKRAKN